MIFALIAKDISQLTQLYHNPNITISEMASTSSNKNVVRCKQIKAFSTIDAWESQRFIVVKTN